MVEKRGMKGRGLTVLREKRDKFKNSPPKPYVYPCEIPLPSLPPFDPNPRFPFNNNFPNSIRIKA